MRPETMTALQAASAIERGSLTCEALAQACLERIVLREPVVHAWVEIDRARTLARARELDRSPRCGLLHGLPIAVKDIIATTDFPTRHGSPIYASAPRAGDASCVAIVRASGALIPGKTVTTEFAYYAPGPTTNPANPEHTPGGSSSGSAAAVADRMVPLGIGTQTAGSIIRPAAYCGIVGFKPTYGRINLGGVKPFAASLDTLGWLARDVPDIELLRSALTGESFRSLEAPDGPIRIGVYRTSQWSAAEPSSQQVVAAAADALRRDAQVVDVDALPDVEATIAAHKTVMAFEAARSLAWEYQDHRQAISAQLIALIEAGFDVPYADYVAAQQVAGTARAALHRLLASHDVLLTPGAPGEAPRGLATTGDPMFNRAWTLLGVPAVTLPMPTGEARLPIGVQLVGAADADRRLLAIAQWIHVRVAGAS